MPVLHKYRGRDDYYILTSISGNVVTFQLTKEGVQRLLENGIVSDKPFRRALLFDLYRSGEAFTRGVEVESVPIPVPILQLSFDFTDDPEPESLFPSCSKCSSHKDLHLVEIQEPDHSASILCLQCRLVQPGSIDSSIPLPLVDRSFLIRFLSLKDLHKCDDSVVAHKKLLEAEFDAKWKPLKKPKPDQSSLWDFDGQKKLF